MQTLDGTFYDVVYVGTDDGRIIKFINIIVPGVTMTNMQNNNSNSVSDGDDNQNRAGENNSKDNKPITEFKTIIITETPPLANNMRITELTISKRTNSLIVIGTGNIMSLSLNHCSSLNICRACLNLQDPHCVWDTVNRECKTIMKSMTTKSDETNKSPQFIQDITGKRINELCAKYGDHQQTSPLSHHQPNILPMAPTRGLVESTGFMPHTNYDDSRITLESIDDNQLKNEIEQRFHLGQDQFMINERGVNGGENLKTSQISTFIGFLSCLLALLVGILIGYYFTRKYNHNLNNQTFHGTEHRNQW